MEVLVNVRLFVSFQMFMNPGDVILDFTYITDVADSINSFIK